MNGLTFYKQGPRTVMKRLAVVTGLLISFAFGLLFASITGWTDFFEIPAVQAKCNQAFNRIECATLQSAEATATIARWTRFDAILSIGAGLAALFAFLAYRQAKRQADAAESSLAHAATALDEQQNSSAAATRGLPSISSGLDKLSSTNKKDTYYWDVYAKNVGSSAMLDTSCTAECRVLSDTGDELVIFRKGSQSFQLLTPKDRSIEFLAARFGVENSEQRIVRFVVNFSWKDVHGYLNNQKFGIEYRLSEGTSPKIFRGVINSGKIVDSWFFDDLPASHVST